MRREKAEKRLARALVLLKKLEWSNQVLYAGFLEPMTGLECKICHNPAHFGHVPGCELGMFLATGGAR